MNWRRAWIISGVILIAMLLAFPLREVANQLILLPLAYLFWMLNLLYLSLHQAFWWVLLVLILLIILASSILPEYKASGKLIPIEHKARGNVEVLTAALQRSHKGIYFKWVVANRLGKLAYQILLQHEHGKPRSTFAPLTTDDWDIDPEIQHYLEKGLHGSFAEFPNTYWNYFVPPEKTPLDQDLKDVVEFLESKMENASSR